MISALETFAISKSTKWTVERVGTRTFWIPGSRYFRRNNHPLKDFAAATCQYYTGDALTVASPKVSCLEDSFPLWQSEQIHEIISRVESSKKLTFVGSVAETLSAVKTV